jgi:hypothetical protein
MLSDDLEAIGVSQKAHLTSFTPPKATSTGNVRRRCVQVTASVPLWFFTHTAALSDRPTRGRIGGLEEAFNLSEEFLILKLALREERIGKNKFRNRKAGRLAGYNNDWNRRKTTTHDRRNSNPFVFGMRRSEMITSGNDRLSAINASNPSSSINISFLGFQHMESDLP